jgi:hypothetical protein
MEIIAIYFCAENKKGGFLNFQVGRMHGDNFGYKRYVKVHRCTDTEGLYRPLGAVEI